MSCAVSLIVMHSPVICFCIGFKTRDDPAPTSAAPPIMANNPPVITVKPTPPAATAMPAPIEAAEVVISSVKDT